MPEGPSILILKEAIDQLHLSGKTVTGVSGNATTIDIERMLHQKVLRFRTWGKHFLVCFKGFSLRIHLMLFGSYRINERKNNTPTLSLQFDGNELNFYTCSVRYIEGAIGDTYDWTADVLSDDWDPKAALEKLKARPKTLVCDILLDQDIFSGVGNIIKNEVLYRIKVHPLNHTGALPPRQLKALVKEARDYSFDFLHWKKEFTLKQHWLAYAQKTCSRCDLPMHKQYLGQTKRRTFYCNNCQEQYHF